MKWTFSVTETIKSCLKLIKEDMQRPGNYLAVKIIPLSEKINDAEIL